MNKFVRATAVTALILSFFLSQLGHAEEPRTVPPSHTSGTGPVTGTGTHAVKATAPAAAVWKISDADRKAAIDYWDAVDKKHPEFAGRRRAFAEAALLKEVDLREAGPHSLEKALFLLSLTPTGRGMLNGVVPKWLKGTVSIEDIEKSTISDKGRAHALYNDGKLFWNPRQPLLTLIPTLLHEGQHAGDLAGTQWEKALTDFASRNGKYITTLREANDTLTALEKAKTDAEKAPLRTKLDGLTRELNAIKTTRDMIRIDAESRGYRSQNWMVQNLADRIPTYRAALKEEVDRKEWIGDPIDEKLFREIMKDPVYNVSQNLVEQYLKANPWK